MRVFGERVLARTTHVIAISCTLYLYKDGDIFFQSHLARLLQRDQFSRLSQTHHRKMASRAVPCFCLLAVLLSTAANVIQDVAQVAELATEKPKGDCPEGLNLVTLSDNGKKYYFPRRRGNWNDTKKFCEAYAMHMASPKNREELTLLHNHGKTTFEGVTEWWVSLTNDGRAKDDFRLHDGERVAVNSTLWNKLEQEPDQYLNGRSCAYINTDSSVGLWDYYCINSDPNFLCECTI
ncbi:Hypothetical predicted protein [Cloeon dipterum]|uniref:C-type lectin domain-containing protein n=1 Tax=Cloeon dipterum TaxID=197152 RepID=A0A8S1DGF7_9INSE|nr:Hypothetical predicted protein [Cloeon dipterum]